MGGIGQVSSRRRMPCRQRAISLYAKLRSERGIGRAIAASAGQGCGSKARMLSTASLRTKRLSSCPSGFLTTMIELGLMGKSFELNPCRASTPSTFGDSEATKRNLSLMSRRINHRTERLHSPQWPSKMISRRPSIWIEIVTSKTLRHIHSTANRIFRMMHDDAWGELHSQVWPPSHEEYSMERSLNVLFLGCDSATHCTRLCERSASLHIQRNRCSAH
jgi:hypothetical protein